MCQTTGTRCAEGNKSRCAWAFDTADVPTTSLTKAVTTATKSGKSNEGPAGEMNAGIVTKNAYLNCIEVRDSLFQIPAVAFKTIHRKLHVQSRPLANCKHETTLGFGLFVRYPGVQ